MKRTQDPIPVARRIVMLVSRLTAGLGITLDSEDTAGWQANRWFVRRRSGIDRCRDDEKFHQWLNADTRHRMRYRQLEELWEFIAVYTNKPEIRSAREKAYRGLSLKQLTP